MPRVRLEDTKEWQLADKSHDVRGRELRDSVGRSLGTIKTMMVDTDTQRIESVVLETGTEYPVRDLQIMEQAVYYIPAAAAPAPAVPETPPAPPFPPYVAPPPTASPATPPSDPALDTQRAAYTERVVPPAPASTYGPPDDYRVESPAVPPPAPPAPPMPEPAVPPPAPPASETVYPAEPYAEPVGPGDYLEPDDWRAPVAPGNYVTPIFDDGGGTPGAGSDAAPADERSAWDREPAVEPPTVRPVEPLTAGGAMPPPEPGYASVPYAAAAPEPAFSTHAAPAESAAGPDAPYRAHFQEHYADTGYAYDDVADTYRFGAEAADDPTLGDDDERLRERFNARYGYRPDDRWAWAGARRAVRYGYDRRRNG